jgi:WXG100 family type VII secretion target
MSQMGANLEDLASLRAAFQQHAATLDELASSMRGRLEGTSWHGPAADRFREAWAGDFEPTLRRLQAALHEAGAEVGRRRDALLQAGG